MLPTPSISFDGENKPRAYCDDIELGTTYSKLPKKKQLENIVTQKGLLSFSFFFFLYN